jgi:hypothetical protein
MVNKNANKRASKITKTRKYRETKKHPRRPRAVMRMDFGRVEQQISLVFPENSKYLNVEIPKEPNPNLISWRFGDLKFAWYIKEKKGFVYDADGIFLGKFLRHDLKYLFFKIGSILRLLKNQKG